MTIKRITATRFARNLSAVLDQVRETGTEYVIERGKQPVARVSPCPGRMTALEALSDLHATLPSDAAETWEADARRGDTALSDDLRDPWAS
jgi:antitoxin (DNA-binding transcriptional repressor) of toxin-antitoxin stability system